VTPAGATAREPLLAVSGLRVDADGGERRATILDGVDLALERGDRLALVGESGCGKSTTALAVLGLLPPALRVRGSIRFDGEELVGNRPALARVRGRRIGMVFQEPATALNPVFSVGEQVAEVLRRHLGAGRRAAWRRAVELLSEVGIADAALRARELPHALSGGMRQRVLIAAAIAAEPDLVIADEPTTALDVTVQAQVLDLLRALCAARGTSLLLISHDLGVVARLARRVAVMYAGRVVERADARALYARPLHPYTRALFDALPQRARPHEPLAAIPGAVPPPDALPAGCRFHPRCPRRAELDRERALRCEREVPALEAPAPGARRLPGPTGAPATPAVPATRGAPDHAVACPFVDGAGDGEAAR